MIDYEINFMGGKKKLSCDFFQIKFYSKHGIFVMKFVGFLSWPMKFWILKIFLILILKSQIDVKELAKYSRLIWMK